MKKTIKAWAIWSSTQGVDEVKISEKDALWSRDWNNTHALMGSKAWQALPCTITLHPPKRRKA